MPLIIIFYKFLLDCEVSPISKFKKSNLSRNCPIITTTPLTNTKNIKNEKIIVDGNITYYLL